MNYYDEICAFWDNVRDSFRDKLTSDLVEFWMGKVKMISFTDSEITMSVASPLKYDVIRNKYLSDIEKRFQDLLGFEVTVNLRRLDDSDAEKLINSGKEFSEHTSEAPENKKPIPITNEGFYTENRRDDEVPAPLRLGSTMPAFNFEYTFDNFIVGNSNKFAHAAATAVAAAPAMNYNPLFIYGPSGLGKTHLLYAITNEVKKRKSDVEIIYIKGEDFTNQLIESLKNQQTAEFRNKYRQCDMLLIDDIQFIAGKESTQEEFFHTFNALYEEHKQIILTSDRPPRDIKTLEDRLKTRFEWGLLADIQPPDFELRMAIIQKKAEQVNVIIPEDVLSFLAENLRSNIRQIEGAIKKIGALAFISGEKITMQLARNCITELLGGEEPISVTVDKIFTSVYQKYGIDKESLIGAKRSKDIAQIRHIAIFLIRNITEMSFPNIGKIFNRDHTTIISSCETIEKRLIKDTVLKMELNEIIVEITGCPGKQLSY